MKLLTSISLLSSFCICFVFSAEHAFLRGPPLDPKQIILENNVTARPRPKPAPEPETDMGGGQGIRSVVYFVNWAIYGRKHFPKDLNVDNLTHVLYSFANVRPDSGEVYLTDTWSDTDIHYDGDSWNDVGNNVYGNIKQFNLLKRTNRNLKVLLSIGGWTYSSNFAQPASTQAGRQNFAKTAVALLENLGLDGLDIDWEYPQDAAQAQNYVELLREVRLALDAAQRKRRHGCKFLLTIACPAGAANYQKLRVREMAQYLDFWNLMAYDYAGSWDSRAGHQANLFPSRNRPETTPFSTQAAVDFYVSSGVPPGNLILGMPLYGRAFAGTQGPGAPFSGTGEGSWEQGVWDYKALPQPDCQVVNDHEIGASYCYSPSKQLMISYDTPEIVMQKADFVRRMGLGGGMWWESSGDKALGQGNLIETFINSVGGRGYLRDRPNCLEYPESKYDNIRG